MIKRLYWEGNSAKTKIITDILGYVDSHQNERILIYDYGCGTCAKWPMILSDYKNITLIGFDPSESHIVQAKINLRGFDAQLLSPHELSTAEFQAKFIVSFSVLEHVYDRRAYLQTAYKRLMQDGVFYLNYDDGHFRTMLDLSAPLKWPGRYRGWLSNMLLEWQGKRGKASNYKRRVMRADIDSMVTACGFQVIDSFYSNLAAFKGLFKTLPPEQREEFSRFWANTENALNSRFIHKTSEKFGDDFNLWHHMGSRTLVLRRTTTA